MHLRSLTKSPLAMIGAALWLAVAGPAWAGAGGEDGGVIQPSLNFVCGLLGMTSCPQLPTATQVVLELAGLETSAPDYVRGPLRLQLCSVAGNDGQPCDKFAINALNKTVPSPVGVADLANLTPLAFTLNKQGRAVPTQSGDPSAVSFLYAVTTGDNGQPKTLDLFYDYPPLTSSTFAAGQIVADISLPLQVLSTTNGSNRLACGAQGCPNSVATLQISAQCNGGPGCLIANIIGDFSAPGKPETRSASALGIQWAVAFAASPNSKQAHAIFEVIAPLLVTGPTSPAQCGKAIAAGIPDPADCGNDPAYFGVTPAGATNGSAVGSPTEINQLSGLPTAFSTDDLGFTPTFLGAPVGIAPSAAPACLGGTCPSPPQSSTFPFCASFSVKGALNPAVAAFFAMGTDGTAYVSAPVVPTAQVACPF